MKLKALASAIAAGTLASQAMALDIGSVTPDITLSISGASAAKKQIAVYIDGICDAVTRDNYTFDDGNNFYEAVFCTVPATANIGPGEQDVLLYINQSSSTLGVGPVATKGTVDGVDLSTCYDDGTNGDATAGDKEWNCTGSTNTITAQIGISDVEPELFTRTENGAKVAVADLANVEAQPVNAQIFGVVVTEDLRDALQAAQGLTPGSNDVSQMPTLSSQLVGNIFAGKIDKWSLLKSGANNLYSGLSNVVSSDDVELCIRKAGSGTQAQFNAFYLGIGCASRYVNGGADLSLSLKGDSSGSDENGIDKPVGPLAKPPFAHWQKSSSNMGQCLSQLHAAGRTGIGLQSLEKVKETDNTKGDFKYIRIDGVAPTLENVASGIYRNWSTLSIQVNTTTVLNGSDERAYYDALVAIAQAPEKVGEANAALSAVTTSISQIYDGATPINTGSLALSKSTATSTGELDLVLPYTPYNKGFTNPSACKIAEVVSKAAIDVSQKN